MCLVIIKYMKSAPILWDIAHCRDNKRKLNGKTKTCRKATKVRHSLLITKFHTAPLHTLCTQLRYKGDIMCVPKISAKLGIEKF